MTISLRQQAASTGLVFGAAADYNHISTDPDFASILIDECTLIVPESSLKWKALRPAPDQYDFTRSDQIVTFACTNQLSLRGHNLIWGEHLPNWFSQTVTQRNAAQYLTEHISTVVKRYAGQMHSWDVVNEALNPAHGRLDGLAENAWLKLLGSNYIDMAFYAAADADPSTLLTYNDYGLLYDNLVNEARREKALSLLKSLRKRGVPVHILGIEAHLDAMKMQTNFNPKRFCRFLRQVADLGIRVLLTELDVTDASLPADISQRDQIVAKCYHTFLSAALSEPVVIGVITWGLSDRYTWLKTRQPRADGLAVRPLPLDDGLMRKPAWEAIGLALSQAPPRSG